MAKPTSDTLPDIRTVALVLSPLLLLSLLALALGSQIQRILGFLGLFFYQFSIWYMAWLQYQAALMPNAREPDVPPPDTFEMALWCLPLLLVTVYSFLFGNEMLVWFGALALVVYITVVLYFDHLYRRYRMLLPATMDVTTNFATTSAKKPNTVKLRRKGTGTSDIGVITPILVVLAIFGAVIMLLPIIWIGVCFLQ